MNKEVTDQAMIEAIKSGKPVLQICAELGVGRHRLRRARVAAGLAGKTFRPPKVDENFDTRRSINFTINEMPEELALYSAAAAKAGVKRRTWARAVLRQAAREGAGK